MRSYSHSSGSFTLTIMSACAQTSSAFAINFAPASAYSASVNPAPSPAPASTSTVCPPFTKAETLSGVSPTRNSWFFSSLVVPIIILILLLCFVSRKITPFRRHPLPRAVPCQTVYHILPKSATVFCLFTCLTKAQKRGNAGRVTDHVSLIFRFRLFLCQRSLQ